MALIGPIIAKVWGKGHIGKKCNRDPKYILCEGKDGWDNRHIQGSSKCREFRKASDFVWAKIDSIFVYSCYISPSLTLPEVENLLDNLVCEKNDEFQI